MARNINSWWTLFRQAVVIAKEHQLAEETRNIHQSFKIIRQKKVEKEIYEIALIAKNSFLKSAVTSVFSLVAAQYSYLAWRSVMKSHYVVLDDRNLRKMTCNRLKSNTLFLILGGVVSRPNPSDL
jgi:c-di-AMP phosphodiesterase-like protein